MKIFGISDTHGKVDQVTIPECDILLHAGDIAPWHYNWHFTNQLHWFKTSFAMWLEGVPAKHIVCVPGNHDWVCEKNLSIVKEVMPPNVHIIHDELLEIEGLRIFGTAWQPSFCNWAFNCSDNDTDLYKKFKRIPDDIDILLTHCPPKGFCDIVPRGENAGSSSLMLRLYEMQPKPLVNVCGHIHCGRGQAKLGDTTIYNVSVVNEAYEVVYEPTEIII